MENTINESDNLIASPLSLEQAKIISRLIMSLNSISLCATIIGISTFLYIRFKYPRLADRVTFRIAFAGIVSEALFSIVQIVLNTQLNPTPLCGFIVWAWVFFSLTSVFFPTCIAINLHATFIHEYNGKRNLEKYYFIGSLILATILSLIPLADKMYDWDEPENFCFFRDSGTRTNIIWQWSVLYGWQILCALYCAIIFVTVLIKLHRVSYQLVETSIDGKTMTNHYEKNILKRKAIMISVIKRISWYPLVPLISQGPNFLYETNIYVAREVNYVMALLTVIIATEGLFNTIVFMQDIAVTRAYRLTKLRWWTNYVNKYEELYPHLSRNKSLISDPLTNSTANVKTEKEEQPKEQQQQPSFAEKLRYNILTLLIKKPKESDTNLSHDPYYVGDYEEESRIKSSVNIGGSDVDVEKYNENEEFNNEIISKM